MKRPGPTLHVIVHETGSTTDMQLVLHKWLAGVCLSYYQYLIYNELIGELTLEDSKAVNESRFSWVM